MLGLDPGTYTAGRLPRGWHVGLFTTATQQSALRPDGLGSLGFDLPDLVCRVWWPAGARCVSWATSQAGPPCTEITGSVP